MKWDTPTSLVQNPKAQTSITIDKRRSDHPIRYELQLVCINIVYDALSRIFKPPTRVY